MNPNLATKKLSNKAKFFSPLALFKKWNLCVNIHSHADFPPLNLNSLPFIAAILRNEKRYLAHIYISSFLLRAHAHKIKHNTIWYLLRPCAQILLLWNGKLTSLKCLEVTHSELCRAMLSTFFCKSSPTLPLKYKRFLSSPFLLIQYRLQIE